MIISRPLSGFLPLSGGTLTGPLYVKGFPVEAVKLDVSARNTVAVTVPAAGTDIVLIDCGTVAVGDRLEVWSLTTITKGAVAGFTQLRITKHAGTAVVTLEGGPAVVQATIDSQTALQTDNVAFGGAFLVTGAGTLTMKLDGVSLVSDGTVPIGNGWIYAHILTT